MLESKVFKKSAFYHCAKKNKIMHKKLFITSLVVLATSFNLFSQSLTVKDSIQTFYDSLFYHLEKDYLFRENIDWKNVKPTIYSEAIQQKTFEESLKSCTTLFNEIKDDHCAIFSEKSYYSNTNQKQFTAKDFSVSFVEKYNAQPTFETQILDNQYAYVLIPGMLLLNPDSAKIKAQEMYDQMVALKASSEIKGWIIDLRFNIGGNAYAMIDALYHLLGNEIVYTELNLEHKAVKVNRLENGQFLSGEKEELSINVSEVVDSDIPVALITGKLTGSAGEDVVLAFRKRNHVLTIGEESYGFLTGNDEVHLPFGVKMAMTTSYLADKSEVYTRTIVPGIKIEKQDNFENLLEDKNVVEAIRFIDSVKLEE